MKSFIIPKYGPGQLWELTAEEFRKLGGEIIFNAKVTQIQTNGENQIESITVQKNQEEQKINGDIFLSSMPVKDLIGGMNDVPGEAARIAKALPYRDFVTVGLLVSRLELKNETNIPTLGNIVPDCWIYVQDTGVRLGRIQIFNNWSPYMVQNPAQQVWIGLEYFCREGSRFWQLTTEESP